MSLSNPSNPPVLNEHVATRVSSGLVFAVDENQTKVNQIHGINPNGSTGAGIPKPVTNVSASIANASVGSTSTISINFQRNPTDKNFSRVVILAKGYQGNNTPVQVGSSADSPATVILNNTGESVSLIVQSVGNGGSSPFNTSPTCAIKLPKNINGGVGTQTTTNLTLSQIPTSSGVSAGVLSATSVIQATPLAVNLSTEGSFDWMMVTGYGGGTVVPNIEGTSSFKCHWKAGNGRLLSAFRLLQNAQLAAGTDTSQFTFSSNTSDDAAYNETVNPAKQPLASRAADPFWFSNNNNLFFYPFGFQWRDIPLPTMAAKTLKFYVYVNNATVTLTARVSDGSAADVTSVVTNGSTAEYIITVNVTPGSFGATLNVSLMLTSFANSASRVGISAVTMA